MAATRRVSHVFFLATLFAVFAADARAQAEYALFSDPSIGLSFRHPDNLEPKVSRKGLFLFLDPADTQRGVRSEIDVDAVKLDFWYAGMDEFECIGKVLEQMPYVKAEYAPRAEDLAGHSWVRVKLIGSENDNDGVSEMFIKIIEGYLVGIAFTLPSGTSEADRAEYEGVWHSFLDSLSIDMPRFVSYIKETVK